MEFSWYEVSFNLNSNAVVGRLKKLIENMIVIWLIRKRLFVSQVFTEGTGIRGQTGQSDKGQKCADFTSANGSSNITRPNLDIVPHLHEHHKYDCRYCESEFEYRKQMLHHVSTMRRDRQFACPQCQRSYISVHGLTEHSTDA